MMALIGPRLAFRYLGIGAAVTAALYSIYFYGYFRKTKPVSLPQTAERSTQNSSSVDCKATPANGTLDTVKVDRAQVMTIFSVEENALVLNQIKQETK